MTAEVFRSGVPGGPVPTVHVISDSVGATAAAMARAAAAQFGETDPRIEVLPNVKSFEAVRTYLEEHAALHQEHYGRPDMVVFYTVVTAGLRNELRAYFDAHPHFAAVDLMSGPLEAIGRVSGMEPAHAPGELHAVDAAYFRRITALEFAIAHDDGRNPQDLPRADIVLLGVSRCGKTPTSVYLAQEGYRVANVPLDLKSEPPAQVHDVARTRLFGLMTTPEVLCDIRRRRLGRAGTVAASYADPLEVARDLDQAHALMRRLGCIVVHTEHRAVEETAQEILRYYLVSHPA